MEYDSKEKQLGKLWFFGAGAFGIILATFLFTTDLRLTYSQNEKKVANEIKQVRMAQTTLSSGFVDDRLSQEKNSSHSNAAKQNKIKHDKGAH